jgi:Zn-dependent peptidase ImmA (M78 family)/transcriptional regulator with XRE-family HTH domain
MSFNPEMLVLAREATGMLQGEFARLLAVSGGTASRWEAGLLDPPDSAQERFAHHLQVTPEFFQRTDRVYGFNSTVFFHRRQQSASDRLLRKLHARMNILRMRIGSLLRSAHIQVPYRFEAFDVGEYQGRVERIAQSVRSLWLMPPGHVRSMVKAIEDAGGILYRMDFETRKIDAISEWVPGLPPIILINSNTEISPSRLRLTLAHELGHLVMHQLPSARDIEDEANRYAGEFLMPRKEIKGSLYRLNLAKLMDLKQEWKVSMAALVYHAHRLETITPTQFKYLNINLRKRWGIHEPLEEEIPDEKPSLLNEVIHAHINELGYGVAEMAKMLFYAKPADFEQDFLNIGRMRLIAG